MITAIINFFTGLFTPVLLFINGLTNEWILSIALLTLLVRIVLLPVTYKQQRFLRVQQNLSQKINQLKGKYKNNQELLNEKMADLITKSKTNPLLGYLSLFAQAPVFMGLYATFNHLTATSSLLPWVQNLNIADSTHILPFGVALINAIGAKLSAVAGNNGPVNTTMLNIFITGVITLLFLWKAPVGIAVYWGTSGVLSTIERLGFEKLRQKMPIINLEEEPAVENNKRIKS